MELNYVHLFERAARLAGGRVALVDGTGAISYGELSKLTNRFGHALVAAGLQPSDPYAVLSPNGSLALAALIGGMKAGGAWSNINLRSAPAINIEILRRGGCRALFLHSQVAHLLPDLKKGVPTLEIVVCLDQDIEGAASLMHFCQGAAETPLNIVLAPDATGFQGSTGGTTGAPKITQVGASFLTWNAIGFMTDMPFERPPVNLAVAPITHAGGIVALTTLALQGTVVLMAAADLGQILQQIERHKVSWLFLPPTLIYMLMNHPECRRTDFASLRYLMSAAAPFAVEKIAQAHEIFGPVICQSFGQTESGFPLTFMPAWAVTEALKDPAKAGRLKSVGLPSANVAEIAILNDAGERLPPGEVGEIVVRGPTTMFRYKDDPEATRAIQAGGWQHTGDLGSIDADGFVYVSDRKRDLIISGGFNVFPLEVEQVRASHSAVQDSAVIGVPDDKWGEAVKAVVELAPGQSVTAEALIQLCKDKLGGVMAPKSVDFIEALPRSAVGKVLKRELRKRYWG